MICYRQIEKNGEKLTDFLFQEGYTDSDGRFALQGDTSELTTIDVQVFFQFEI